MTRLLADQVRYQVRLIMRTPRAAVAGLVLPVLLLVLNNRGGRVDPQVVAGMSVLGLINIAFVTHAAGLVGARESGVLRRWRASPLPAWCYFTGRIVATMVIGVGRGAVAVLAAVCLYGMRLSAWTAVVLALVFAVGALTWASVGTALTAAIPSADGAMPLLSVTYFPLLFLSGAFGGFANEPHWLTTLVRYLPAQPVVDLARHAVRHTGQGLPPVPVGDLAVLGGWAVAGLAISVLVFRWDPRRPG